LSEINKDDITPRFTATLYAVMVKMAKEF